MKSPLMISKIRTEAPITKDMMLVFKSAKLESFSRFFVEEAGAYWLFVAFLYIFVLYVLLALTPSHYAMGLKYLGADMHPLLGSARPIRSDEWIVMTPLFQTAVRGGFSTTNMISPYHETLKGFFALPIWDWSLLFKPQLWGFWLLPPAYAYSLYFAMLWASFLAGYTILLRQLGAPLWIAALGSLALFFSHYVQVWWTSNAPTFAFAPWPLIVFLLPIRPLWKLPLLFWTSALWVFSYVYPPFLITAPFAMAILLLAFRRDALSWAHTLVGGVALAALGAAFYLYFGDLIEIMQATVYPGQRISVGGGVPWPKLLAHLLPFFNTLRFAPLLPGSNDCEIAVVSTLLPLAGISFVRYRSIIPYVRTNFLALGIVIVGLAMMLAWMWLPIPPRAGQFLLWTKVPPHRMLWAFGLLFTLAVILIASKLQFELTRERFLLFSLSLIAAWLVSKIGLTDGGDITVRQALGRTWWFDLFPILPFGVAAVVCLRSRFGDQGTVRAIFAAAAVSGAATFGSFNPLQPAFPIFNLPRTPFLAAKREEAKRNPNGWLVIPGGYGALFSGAGIPAINHTLTTPQLEFFRKVFPNMPADQFNQVFNRYAHIHPQPGDKLYSPQADVIVVPIEPFLKPILDLR